MRDDHGVEATPEWVPDNDGNQLGWTIHHIGATQVWLKTSKRLQHKILLQLHQIYSLGC